MDELSQLKASLAERYEIEREIGSGGMATVYLARDLRHDRHVAVKVLKADLGAVLGVERFLSEIKVTANLQHPNLLPLFDSGEADGLLFYVMPYVEGETLRSRLDREKQLPVDEAIRMTVGISNALDYAHSHGVIHRDLKPENILLQAGQPVIADFGIALAVSKAGGNRITQTGLSLGTPNYMSPEQATGDRIIDARSDIYSLGAMTYEMLTGEPPHTGSTSQAVIARMLTEKPRPIRTTRSVVPEYVEAAVQRALEKLPADRFSTAREFAEALQGRMDFTRSSGAQSRARPASSMKTRWLGRLRDPLVAALAVLSVVLLGLLLFRPRGTTSPALTVRYSLSSPDSAKAFDSYPWPGAISPDGSTVVFSVRRAGIATLFAQKTNQLEAHPIPGTIGAFQPLFSPDGQWVAFESNGKLRKVRLDGSAPIAVADAGSANGADWTTQDEFILGSESRRHGLSHVSASGGELVEFALPNKAKGETDYLWPIGLPDGKTAVFAIWTGSLSTSRLATASIKNGDVVPLDLKGVRPLAVIGRILVYVQIDGAVMAVSLTSDGRHLAGSPTPVLDPVKVVAGNNGNSGIFISRGGALLTSRGGESSQLAWLSRDGVAHPISQAIRNFSAPRLSPDGKRIAVRIADADKSAVWIYDLMTSTMSRLSAGESATSPVWMPDGRRVAYISAGDKERFAVWVQDADGGSAPEKLFEIQSLTNVLTVAPDGRNFICVAYRDNAWQLLRVDLDSGATPVPYLADHADNTSPQFSPDGKWVAYESNNAGRVAEVYIRSYPNPSSRIQASAGGGDFPVWSADGSQLFYVSGTKIMSARLSKTHGLSVVSRDSVASTNSLVSAGSLLAPNFDVARDGRFLGLAANRNDFDLVIVPNWLPEMEQRLAGSKR